MSRWVSWSGGKDAGLALNALEPSSVEGLLTTVSETTDQVPVHGVPARLIESQAAALGLRFRRVRLPTPCPNEVYTARLHRTFRELGIREMVFGDLHLEDIVRWRRDQLEPLGIRTHFPLLGREPRQLAEYAIETGVVAQVCSVDTTQLAPTFLGRSFDQDLLRELPVGVDPMGENGEFHTLLKRLDDIQLVEETPHSESILLPDGRHRVLQWASAEKRRSAATSDGS